MYFINFGYISSSMYYIYFSSYNKSNNASYTRSPTQRLSTVINSGCINSIIISITNSYRKFYNLAYRNRISCRKNFIIL